MAGYRVANLSTKPKERSGSALHAATPEKRDARPSAFSKLFYFMRPDKGKMALSLMMACIGETLGMVPYVVVAALAAGLVEGTLSLETAAWLAAAAR